MMMKPRVDRLQVYESPQHLVLLGHRRRTGRWRIVTIDRTRAEGDHLPLTEDPTEFASHAAAIARLAELSGGAGGAGGAAATGGGSPLVLAFEAVALLGAVRFLDAYYLLFVTRREPVGILAGHTIFRAEETAMISLRPGGFSTASRVGSAPRAPSSSAAPTRRAAAAASSSTHSPPLSPTSPEPSAPSAGRGAAAGGASAASAAPPPPGRSRSALALDRSLQTSVAQTALGC